MFRFRPQDGEAQVAGLLTDQAFTARALLDAHEVTGDGEYFDDAVELAELIAARFADTDGGGFFDVWGGGSETGRLRERQKSLQDNTCVAEVLLRLHHLTRDERWQTLARTTLEAFAGTYAHMGHMAAAYGRQVDILLNPPAEVNIVGADDGLLRAALRLDVPARVVQLLDPARDAERLAALGLPAQPAPAAYACAGTMCSPPVTDAALLAETVAGMQSGPRVIELPE
jgi:uncharacterized protein YyaL (SSP411 family)